MKNHTFSHKYGKSPLYKGENMEFGYIKSGKWVVRFYENLTCFWAICYILSVKSEVYE